MAKFRKRPVVIEAIQFEGLDADMIKLRAGLPPEWLIDALKKPPHEPGAVRVVDLGRRGRELHIVTLEGPLKVSPGDWIIKGTANEIYPCKPDIFAAIYEPVEGDSETSQPGVLAAKPESSDSQGGVG